MTKRIFRSIFLVALCVLVLTMGLVLTSLYRHYFAQLQAQLRTETVLAAQGVQLQGEAFFEGLSLGKCRITWVDPEGNVLFDSHHSGDMENHISREEIAEALKTGYGESIRYSDTLMEQTLYAAQRLTDGTVIRLSMAQESTLSLLLGVLQPVILSFAVILLLALLLAARISRKIVEPLNRVDLDAPMADKGYQEISPLLHRIESQKQQLRQKQLELLRKQDEFDAVTANMNEGLVLLNNKGRILSSNKAADRILSRGHCLVGQDILTLNRTLEIHSLLLSALNGGADEAIVHLEDKEYEINTSPVFSDGMLSGVVLLLFDVTDKHRAERLRQEFTANVSHELKTPLQSISGYAELMAGGIVQPEDMPAFAQKIYQESQRMIQLVADILHLSRLDEGGRDMSPEDVELRALAAETLASLEPQAAQAGITLSLEGPQVQLYSVRQLLSGILRNLCDNAIKYNRPGGSVQVSITQLPEQVQLTVRDNGIGIPAEHLDRIFERFYRVDKSRSKQVGGTGLGLSIVKHAVKILDGQITVESTPDVGTAITVILPKLYEIDKQIK